METKHYNLYEDPGHSWLKVPVNTVIESGVFDKITQYSPRRGGYLYLEEDCDIYPFVKAMENKGIKVMMDRVWVEDFDEYLENL